jgi:hypothetical protein
VAVLLWNAETKMEVSNTDNEDNYEVAAPEYDSASPFENGYSKMLLRKEK